MIAVTGAAGFLGRRVVRLLAGRGIAVRPILRRPAQAPAVNVPGAEPAYADIRDPDAIETALNGADAIIHLAAILRERRGATYASVNETGCANIYAAAVAAGVRKAVHVSVVGAAPESHSGYLASRWRGERAALESGAAPAVVRLSALFGEGDEFTNALAAFIRLGPLVPVAGSGKNRLQPLSADDAAEAIVRAIDGAVEPCEITELGGPDVMTYNEIVDATAAAMGRRAIKLHAPLTVIAPAVWVLEHLLPTPPVTSAQLKMLRGDNVAGGRPFSEVFGFAPMRMRDNIDYVRRVGYREAIQIAAGRMPRHIRDH